MKKIVMVSIMFILFYILVGSVGVKAQKVVVSPAPIPTATVSVDYTLPYPGILPDHPLYFLKELRDRIVGWFISDPVKRVEFDLLMADKRLAMGQGLQENGENDLAFETVSKGEKYIEEGVGELSKMNKSSAVNTNIVMDRLSLAIAKHKEMIGNMMLKDANRKDKWQNIIGMLNKAKENLDRMR